MATTDRSNTRIAKTLASFYKQISQLGLLFIALLIALASTTVLVMELTHGAL